MPTLKTSISGIRGIIGDGLDIRTVVDYTSAFACLFPKKAKVLVARDTRITGESILNAVVSTLMASGINVIDIGITPTPTALYMVEKLKIHGGIMISASHNPIEWNALKLIGKGGHFLDEKAVNELMKLYDKKSSRFVKALETGTYEKIDNAIEEHIKRILRWIDVEKIKKANFKVACDYVNGTGLFATPPLLKALGVKEVSINNVHTGKFAHVAEPSAASMKSLSDLVKKNKVNIGFTQDPDADRLALVLDDGTIISEEYTLALCAKYLWHVGKGNAAVNLSTSRMIDDLAKEKHLILICGHYEGFDERIRTLADMEISIGDYVLTGGELASMVITDSITRLIDGVIEKESHLNDSFNSNLLDYPVYTKPVDFKGMKVPEVLLSGHHANIAKYRQNEALKKTKQRRPDLLENGDNNG